MMVICRICKKSGDDSDMITIRQNGFVISHKHPKCIKRTTELSMKYSYQFRGFKTNTFKIRHALNKVRNSDV